MTIFLSVLSTKAYIGKFHDKVILGLNQSSAAP